jgi:hypothetical protein
MDGESRVLSFEPDAREIEQVTVDHSQAMIATARRCRILGMIEIALGLLLLLITSYAVFRAIGVASITFGFLLFIANTTDARRRQVRLVVKRTPALLSPQQVTATPDGLRVVTATSDQRFGWLHYQAVIDEEVGVTFVLRGGTGVRFVPRRAFADATEQSGWARRADDWVSQATPAVTGN